MSTALKQRAHSQGHAAFHGTGPGPRVPTVLTALLMAGCMVPPVVNGPEEISRKIQAIQEAPPLIRNFDRAYVDTTPVKVTAQPAYLEQEVSIRADLLPLRMLLEASLRQLEQPPNLAFSSHSNPDIPVSLNYQGSFAQLLELMTDLSGHLCTPQEKLLRCGSKITRIFNLVQPAGRFQFQIGGQAGNEGGGAPASSSLDQQGSSLGQDGQFMEAASTTELRQDLQEALESIVGEDAVALVSESGAAVSITGAASKVMEAERYLQQVNEELSRQVRLDIQVLQVELSREHSFGIDWELVRRTAHSTLKIGGGELEEIFRHLPEQVPTLRVSKKDTRYAGSSGLIRALASQGRVSVETSPTAVVANHQVAELRFTNQTSYLASTTPGTTTGSGNVQSGLQPGVITDGVSFFFLPRILDDNRVYLHISARLSSLQSLRSVSSSGQTIQVPTLNESRFSSRHLVEDGETLVIGGLRERRQQHDQRAPWGATVLGTSGKSSDHSETVVLITPTVL